MQRRWWRLLVVVLLSLVVAACGGDQADQASTPLRVLDITSGRKVAAESYWTNGTPGILLSCFHGQEGLSAQTEAAYTCVWFTTPESLDQTAVLLAMNLGQNQKTTSVWLLPNGSMATCLHDRMFGGGTNIEVKSCEAFTRPEWVDPAARLNTINAGAMQKSQSFWTNPDGSYAICNHEKEHTGFLGLGGTMIGDPTTCRTLTMETPLAQMNLVNPDLVGMTSDDARPPETFWQDENGTIVRCNHHWDGDWGNGGLGEMYDCTYWKPFWDNVVPEPPVVVQIITTPVPSPEVR
jgi:hypothetical protein